MGGAIALAIRGRDRRYPVGDSGARLAAQESQIRMVTMCVGMGQARQGIRKNLR